MMCSEHTTQPQSTDDNDSGGRNREEFPVIGVGASAGGLQALIGLLSGLPEHPGAAIVLVQHLEPTHSSRLAEILKRSTTMPVRQVEDGLELLPDHVYVIPPNTVMRIAGGIFILSDRPVGRLPIHTIDEFMISMAEECAERAIGVVLSGAASDGVAGLSAIKSAGGIALVQDPTEAAYDSMPRSAIAAGVADKVLPVAGIAQELGWLTQHPQAVGYLDGDDYEPPASRDEERDVRSILAVVHNAKGIDLNHYKWATLLRRIARRMVVRRVDSYGAYLEILKNDREETGLLFGDLLVRVTSFFRDPGVFDSLKNSVFPNLLADSDTQEPVRVWIPGCATGQEPYSIVMLLIEYLESIDSSRPIQVFASDIKEDDLLVARRATYSTAIESQVTPERLERFFRPVEDGYQLTRGVRDAVVFARHDVTADPPFARLHLVSCRNLLIYIDPYLQRTLLSVFHYALNLEGVLMLGESEGVGAAPELFDPTEAKGIFRRTPVQTPMPILVGRSWRPVAPNMGAHPQARESGPVSGSIQESQRQLDAILLDRFSPAALIVDSNLTILHVRGGAGSYLRLRPGTASLELASMTSQSLASTIASAVTEATETGATARRADIRVKVDDTYQTIAIVVAPLHDRSGAPHFAVMIEPVEPPEADDAEDPTLVGQVYYLEQELEATRDRLRSFEFRGDVVNQDLLAANEEVQSSNEELQSINEELETAKEELQSTNEELTTLNDELQSRNSELSLNNDDLRNLLSRAGIAIVMLDKNLRLRRYTDQAVDIFNFIPSDVGRPLTDIHARIDIAGLELTLRSVLNGGDSVSREQSDDRGNWFKTTVQPFITSEGEIAGVVISMYDIDAEHRYQEELKMTSHFAVALTRTSSIFDSSDDFEGALSGVACVAANALDAELAELAIRDGDRWVVRAEVRNGVSVAIDRPYSPVETTSRPLGESPGGPGVPDQSTPDSESLSEEAEGGAHFDLPIMAENDEPIGVVRFVWEKGRPPLRPPEKEFLARLGTMMGLVYERSQRLELAERLAEQKTAELRQTAEQLMIASDVKDQFMANMSHELRTPLNSIIGFSKVMLDGLAGSVNEEQQRQLQMVLNAGNHLLAVITDILDLEKIQAGAALADVTEISVGDVVREVVDLMRPLADAKDLTLTFVEPETPLVVQTDRLKLQQILLNLVSNAVKYTRVGGVDISTRFDADTFTVVIADTGVGMTPEASVAAFEEFGRIEGRDPAEGGTGLGLTIARRLAVLLGGGLSVDTEPGAGSTFYLALPNALDSGRDDESL